MNDINEVYEKYSKVNQYKNVGLTDFYKIENNTKYYFLPDWISQKKENQFEDSSFLIVKAELERGGSPK